MSIQLIILICSIALIVLGLGVLIFSYIKAKKEGQPKDENRQGLINEPGSISASISASASVSDQTEEKEDKNSKS